MSSSNKTLIYLAWFGVVAVTAALAVYAYLGFFSRYMADDYCLLVDLRFGDLFTNSWNKYLFKSNRFSNLFVLGFWELFPGNIAIVPALHIILWVLGLTWLLSELDKVFNLKLAFPLRLFAAETLALFSFFTTPNAFQILYWRPGQVSYLTPIVFFTLLAAWLVNLVRRDKVTFPLAFLFGFFAFFIGGLSETLGALHIAILSLVILCVVLFDKSPRRNAALTLLGALLIGAFAALIVMFLAPANEVRINDENGSPAFTTVLLRNFEYSLLFLRIAITTLPLPILGLLAISSLMTMLLFQNQPTVKFEARAYWLFLIIPILLYGLVFASFAPSAYGQSYPVERVRFPAHFILTLALTSFGICAGYVLSYVKFPTLIRYGIVALAFLSLLYPFWMMRQPLSTYEFRRLFALRWDEREQMIYDMKASGEQDLVLPGLDGYEGTKELDVRPFFWVNQCAAQIYGVHTITAISVEEEDVLYYFSE
ncbi:MAG: hypothetical protein JNK32_07655 [Anaerolineales bacterium]|nr:hypothetical protein [Anaerolineales bacterium]